MTKRLLLVCLILTCLPLFAQKMHEKKAGIAEEERPVSEARSFMELFSKLENRVALAVQQKDALSLDATLASEFILRSADDPKHPVLRADWIREALNNSSEQSYSLSDFTIRAFATEAIVSYVQHKRAVSETANDESDIFVVDLWVVNHAAWQLAARYPARMGKHFNTE